MNPAQLLEHFDRISEAPDTVARLRRFILDLAVRGKLTNSLQVGENTKPLGKLAEFIMGQAPPGHACNESGEGTLFVKVGEFGDRYPEHKAWTTQPLKFAKSGDVLICVVGATVGKLNLAVDCAIGRSVAAIRPSSNLRTEYLYYSLMPFTLSLRDSARGSAQGVISKPDLSAIPIWCPTISEQDKVVAKVDELMALCDQLETAKNEREARRDRLVAASLHRIGTAPAAADEAATEAQSATPLRDAARFHLVHLPRLTTRPEHVKQLRQTILNLAVRGCLVPQNSDEEPAAELLKRIQTEKARLVKEGLIPRSRATAGAPILTFELPPNWQAMRFDDVCNLVTSGSRGWAEYYADSGPKFVRAQNIRFGRLRLDDLACVNPPANGEGKRTHVTEGDLLIVITGAGATNPALMDRDLGEAYVSQHVALIKPSSTAMSRWLLLCLMSGPGGRDELVERAYGAGKPGLNLDNIRSLNAPLPPLAEQHRIVAKVDELMALCDQLEAQLTATHTDSRRLLEAVLHEALAAAA